MYVYDTTDSPCSNPVTLFDCLAVMYSMLPALTHHSLSDFIDVCTGHKELHQIEVSQAFLCHLQTLNDRVWEWVKKVGRRIDLIHARLHRKINMLMAAHD